VNAPSLAVEPEIVSKSEFARLSNVSAARVTQWIADKKIYGEAIVGEGRSSQIRVAAARAQLKRHLDIGQRLGNGLSTTLDGPAAAAAQIEAPLDSGAQIMPFQRPSAQDPPRDPIEEQIKRERLETARRTNRKMAEEEAARSGRYVLAENAAREVGKSVTLVFSSVDGWIAEAASKMSAKFGLPQRDVLHLMRGEFQTFRAKFSATLRKQAESLPEFVEDEMPEVEGIEDDQVS
jgi:hypothetical protein